MVNIPKGQPLEGPPPPPRKRLKTAARGYNALHQRQRVQVIREQSGICAICRKAFAAELDHIDGNPWNKDRANLQGLCKPCHRAKTHQQRNIAGNDPQIP